MQRRSVISLAGGATLSAVLPGIAQTTLSPRRIGFLGAQTKAIAGYLSDAFLVALAKLGWKEGQNIIVDWRYSDADVGRMDEIASELVSLKPDLILAPTTVTAQAAMRATNSIPIVFVISLDPIGSGLVTSWSRPGGNVTGLSTIIIDLAPKHLQLLKETVPLLSKLAILHEPAAAYNSKVLALVQSTAPKLGIELSVVNAADERGIEAAFIRMSRERPDGIFVMNTLLTFRHRQLIATRAATIRVPAIYSNSEFADAGGLMSYGPSYIEQFRRAATYVDKILRGAKPNDLPVEQPVTFELVINLKTAKALGLTIPQPVLLRADRVIE